MNKQHNDIFDKARISTNLLKFAKTNELVINELAGKPKQMAVEIVKRYLKNPYVLIATAIFIFIIVFSIVINHTSVNYHPENLLLPSKKSPFVVSDSVFARDLPPQANPVKTIGLETDSELYILIDGIKWGSPEINKHLNFKYDIIKDDSGKWVLVGDLFKSGLKNDKLFAKLNVYEFYKARYILQFAQEHFKSNSILDFIATRDADGALIMPKIKLTQEWVDKAYERVPQLYSILGTDDIGRDIWTRTWAGTWESIQLALIVATIETIIGVAIGAWLGFHAGKRVDTLVMRLIEIITAPPSLIWFIMLVSIMGTSSLSLAVALIVIGWVGPVGGTRMFVITVKDEEYIVASKSLGASTSRQVFSHALPAVIGKISYSFVQRIPSVILSVSSLAFLGFFNDESSSNLGKILNDAVYKAGSNPWVLILPSVILASLSLSLHFIALGVHDAFDPKVIRAK